ncbi:hypothetical protein EZW88_24480 [Salmonella enterica subsp. enterica serovar Bredeney]|nr:hypothetical protein [Salmonella enterica subsp. enterica serovar Bredeney]EDO5628592.1 hypothetical protein [Salmonella enterica]EDR9399190.1 hypothetical protein [Salmonella enterica subsp. enterica]EDT6893221.1 hypothetical protein [Salmonella enterica subsp. enterica serovar Javiana]EHW1129183.1 hypothetical protein [Salmonella enterica subsp. enterica serovar Kinondoni]
MSKEIAVETLNQLGGNKFIAMTGAKNFVWLEKSGLIFKLPSDFARNGINLVRIKLEPSDTYNIEFLKSRGASLKSIASFEIIYCDQLQEIFTVTTGRYTHL